ncbi:hypothetical protein [Streptomyces sp. LaBMicrA B280]
MTPPARRVHAAVRAGQDEEAGALLPEKRAYPVGEDVLARLGA